MSNLQLVISWEFTVSLKDILTAVLNSKLAGSKLFSNLSNVQRLTTSLVSHYLHDSTTHVTLDRVSTKRCGFHVLVKDCLAELALKGPYFINDRDLSDCA